MENKRSADDLRGYVRQRYGEIARDALRGKAIGCAPDCCPPGDATPTKLIPLEAIAGNPDGAINLSLGCGDPLALAELRPGQTVLDLGSGAGLDCFQAAQWVGEGGRVIGVDMTADMISLARLNQARLGLKNLEFRQGEIENLPVADCSVDVVISNCVINLSPDKPQALREAWRVLKPGGRLEVSDVATLGELAPELRANLSSWASCVAGALDVHEYRAALEAAGFVDIEIEPVLQIETPEDAQPTLAMDQAEQNKLDGKVFSVRIRAIKP